MYVFMLQRLEASSCAMIHTGDEFDAISAACARARRDARRTTRQRLGQGARDCRTDRQEQSTNRAQRRPAPLSRTSYDSIESSSALKGWDCGMWDDARLSHRSAAMPMVERIEGSNIIRYVGMFHVQIQSHRRLDQRAQSTWSITIFHADMCGHLRPLSHPLIQL